MDDKKFCFKAMPHSRRAVGNKIGAAAALSRPAAAPSPNALANLGLALLPQRVYDDDSGDND